MPTPTPSQLLWSRFTEQIVALMGVNGTEAGVQILPSAELLSGTKESDIDKSIESFSQVIPQWGSMYSPSARTLITSYQLILSQIKETATSSSSIEKEYETENKKLAKMMGTASDFKVGKIEAWEKTSAIYKKAGMSGPDFSKWFKNNGWQEYKSLLALQKAQTQKVANLLKAAGVASPVTGALDRLNTELSNASDQAVAPANLNPAASVLAGWSSAPTNPGGLSFGESTTTYDYSKTIWKSQTGVSVPFFSVGAKKQAKSFDKIVSSSTDYRFDVEFAAQAAVSITQGSWFDDAVLAQYKAGPWIPGSSIAQGTAQPYGQSGLLPLSISRVLVVLDPAITITLTKSVATLTYSSIQSQMSNGVNLGPFAFGGSDKDHSSTVCTASALKETQSITLRDTSGIPQIVALDCLPMP